MVNITKFSVIRIIELALICIIIGLHAHSVTGTSEDSLLSAGTEVGFLMILTGLLAAAMMDMPVNRSVELGFLLVGFALFIASGAVVIDWWRRLEYVWVNEYNKEMGNMMVARGSISIIEGALLLGDAFLVFKGQE